MRCRLSRRTTTERTTIMKRLLLATAAVLTVTATASAQSPGPGWVPTGEWQCKGGLVRIISSTDGLGAVNFEIKGAWFDNNYTLRRDQFYYNGTPCVTLGDPWAWLKEPRQKPVASKDSPSDKRCREGLSPQEREEYCE